MNYNNYIAEDFAADESFQDYYLHKKLDETKFWENWINQYPTKIDEIAKAKELLNSVSVPVADNEIQEAYLQLQQNITKSSQVAKTIPLRRKFFKIAASIAAVLVLGLSAYYFLWPRPNPVWSTTQTAFGEIKSINLPDGSTVLLNSNSQLKFDSLWPVSAAREVWLEGEAYFSVAHDPAKGERQFIVHNNKDTRVNVLGTVFNVYNRNDNIAVVLESGKVEVEYQLSNQALKQTMAPSDIFEISKTGKVSLMQATNTELYTAWKENKLILEKTPLKKVVDILEENFGFEVNVQNQKILDRKLTATIPIIDVTILLEALEEIYGLDVTKEDRKIWIK